MEMESSTSRPSARFRFRDHSESEIAGLSDAASDSFSSVSSDLRDGDDDDETDLDSMAGMGIKHLCSELQELKLESNEEFHKHIFSNYTVFIRMFEQMEHLENEIDQMKSHISTQKVLVKELVDIASSKALLPEESMDSIDEEFELDDQPWGSIDLEEHIKNVMEILEILLLENRFEEALDVIDFEEEKFRNMQLVDSHSLDDLRFYSSVISEWKSDLTSKLTLLAQNKRIAAPELQKALLGLCRLGESDHATQLMLDYYDAHIARGICNLQRTRSFSDGNFIRELSKLVFSLISQAARSFEIILGGDQASPYGAELIEWAKKETKAFVDCFNQYLKFVSELGGGLLAMAVQAVQISMTFCSLLVTHRLALRPYLVKQIRPAIEEFVNVNVEHLKKVISVFSASDTWVLGRYIISGITNEGCHSMVVGQETECCNLTSSGRKFARLVKNITEDAATLFDLQMEGVIFTALVNLLKEYAHTIDKALFYDSDVSKKDDSRINSAMSLQHQISILANLYSLEQILPRMIRHIYGESQQKNSDYMNEHGIGNNQKKIDTFTRFVQEASSQIRIRFCQRYVTRIMSQETISKLTSEIGSNVQSHASVVCDVTPSVALRTLFLELRKIERLAEGDIFEKQWLSGILMELIQTTFVWISTNKDKPTTKENSVIYNQFVVDLKFLVQITKNGGYFTNQPLVLENIMESMIFGRDINDDENLRHRFDEVIQKLLEIEKTAMLPNNEPIAMSIVENETIAADNSDQEDFASFSDNSMDSNVAIVATDKPKTATIADTYSLNKGVI